MRSEGRPRPSVPVGAWGIVAAYLGAQVAMAALLALVGRLVPPGSAAEWSLRLTYGASSAVLLAAAAVAVLWAAPTAAAGIGTLRRLWAWPGTGPLALGVAAGVLLKVAGDALLAAERAFLGNPGTNNPLVLYPTAFAQPVLVALVVLAAAVLAPAAEELFFRGLLYGWLRGRTGAAFSIAAAAVLFGLAHRPIALAVPLAAVGAGLCYLYERWRSLWVSAAAHMAINVSSLVIALRLH